MGSLVSVGDVVGGHWRVSAILREGRTTIAAGTHATIGRTCALQILRDVENPAARERFIRASTIGAILETKHIANVIDFGTHNEDMFTVMDLLEGFDLARALAMRGPLPVSEVVAYASQACLALTDIHESGVIHRDVRPGHLFAGTDGVLKLLDFGAASRTSRPTPQWLLEGTGTPRYMPPEQIRGDVVDERADIWALGVTIFELLTGGVPAERPPNDPAWSRLPVGLQGAIVRCLENDPARRHASAAELMTALSGVG
jgi:eukaryotic-like serine/threonine-protein kinase